MVGVVGAGWSLRMRIVADNGLCPGEKPEDALAEGTGRGESASGGAGNEEERRAAGDVEHCVV